MSQVAVVQMAAGPNVNANLLEAERLLSKAAAAGAKLVVLPENFYLMGQREQDKLALREVQGQGPLQEFLSRQAARHRVWIVGGTLPLAGQDPQRVRAASLLFDDHGQLVARYDKIHLFDVDVPETGERYRESETIEPGENSLVIDTPFGRLGMVVCYDLRFPELFRAMLDQGADLVSVPSAFTAATGKAHWEVLLRARAIENLCYVLASAQGGYHSNGRETYGDSMIVDPWGRVLDRLPRGSGVVMATLDRHRQEQIRRNFPVLTHRSLHCRL